jgi:hypothetical protein
MEPKATLPSGNGATTTNGNTSALSNWKRAARADALREG